MRVNVLFKLLRVRILLLDTISPFDNHLLFGLSPKFTFLYGKQKEVPDIWLLIQLLSVMIIDSLKWLSLYCSNMKRRWNLLINKEVKFKADLGQTKNSSCHPDAPVKYCHCNSVTSSCKANLKELYNIQNCHKKLLKSTYQRTKRQILHHKEQYPQQNQLQQGTVVKHNKENHKKWSKLQWTQKVCSYFRKHIAFCVSNI